MRIIHGDAFDDHKTREYQCWIDMKARCLNPRNSRYRQYGGRGIKVCERWLIGENGKHPFLCFLEDIGRRPSPEHSIDRIDNNGNYDLGNVRWATRKEQNDNRRHYLLRGSRRPLAKLSEQQINTIRSDRRSQRAIASEYGVTQSVISEIKSGKAWAHVD